MRSIHRISSLTGPPLGSTSRQIDIRRAVLASWLTFLDYWLCSITQLFDYSICTRVRIEELICSEDRNCAIAEQLTRSFES